MCCIYAGSFSLLSFPNWDTFYYKDAKEKGDTSKSPRKRTKEDAEKESESSKEKKEDEKDSDENEDEDASKKGKKVNYLRRFKVKYTCSCSIFWYLVSFDLFLIHCFYRFG